MLNKIADTVKEAIADICDGASITMGGFSVAETPHNLVKTVSRKGLKNITLIGNVFFPKV